MYRSISIHLFFSIILLAVSCKTVPTMNEQSKYIEEIRKAEADFAAKLKDDGMALAFLEFAAPDAVLNRNDKLYRGKEEIRAYLESSTLTDVQLDWAPDHIEVSQSGDLGYTFGPYTFSARDSKGNQIAAEGIFHTVWKRQEDGSWKYVWD
jgi:ketosteroid isomerase-like protein